MTIIVVIVIIIAGWLIITALSTDNETIKEKKYIDWSREKDEDDE